MFTLYVNRSDIDIHRTVVRDQLVLTGALSEGYDLRETEIPPSQYSSISFLKFVLIFFEKINFS